MLAYYQTKIGWDINKKCLAAPNTPTAIPAFDLMMDGWQNGTDTGDLSCPWHKKEKE